MDIPILYSDTDLLVIDKPSGVVVNRAQTVKGETIQDWADKKLKIKNARPELGRREKSKIDKESDFYKRNGIVHRLDKETSGVLIIAKTLWSFEKLQKAFKDRSVKKEYVALISGKLNPKSGEINAPVGRLPWNSKRFGVVPGGKPAHTHYEVAQYYENRKDKKYTLVNLFPTSGRTHQLRVHLKYLGFPIVGDYLYAGRKTQKSDRTWCKRVFLHALTISFIHPITGKNISVASEIPKELTTALSSLLPKTDTQT